VGEGGRGIVYCARQLSLQRVVAVKVLRPAADGATPHAFQGETRLLASLSYPNVLAIHDWAEGDGFSYLVMEFVAGPSLRELMERVPMPVAEAAALLDRTDPPLPRWPEPRRRPPRGRRCPAV
jgi:serine/threonine-protein kinase